MSTTYTGANAVAVEQAVATSIEQQVNGADNMLYMKSTSANDGTLLLSVDFEVGTNPDIDNARAKPRCAGDSGVARRSQKLRRYHKNRWCSRC